MCRRPIIRPSTPPAATPLNATRADMVEAGFSPSIRLFEAAACAAPVISDVWPGLDQLFHPGRGDRPRPIRGRT
ncbi:MAG: glycosyltransferase [Brevundimonas sp.]|nr:glycosyltransferase [Brevundimonas sp.]